MSNNEFKKTFDNIEPDLYMEGRILANIKESKNKRAVWKPVLSGVLAITAAIGCFGIVQYKNIYTDRPFSVMVVGASDDVPVTEEIGDDAVVMANLRIINHKEKGAVESRYESGFVVTADDIASVSYECNTGNFYYADFMRGMYDEERREYYDAVIPVSDEEALEMEKYINSQQFNPELAGIRKYAETHDLSEYFGSKDIDFQDYWIYFQKYADAIGYENEDGYAFFIVNAEKGMEYYYQYQMDDECVKNLTVNYYELSDSILNRFTIDQLYDMQGVRYNSEAAVSALLENPDMKLSELPSDEITITVKFKDGKKARKTISVTFNDEGYAQFAFIN